MHKSTGLCFVFLCFQLFFSTCEGSFALKPGERLSQDECLENGNAKACLSSQGLLVVSGGKSDWASGSSCTPAGWISSGTCPNTPAGTTYFIELSKQGNAAIFSTSSADPIWQTGTAKSKFRSVKLHLTKNGILMLDSYWFMGLFKKTLWTSKPQKTKEGKKKGKQASDQGSTPSEQSTDNTKGQKKKGQDTPDQGSTPSEQSTDAVKGQKKKGQDTPDQGSTPSEQSTDAVKGQKKKGQDTSDQGSTPPVPDQGSAASATSTDIAEVATGIVFPGSYDFSSKPQLTALGAGVRVKNLGIANVNVYAVAMYVDKAKAAKALSAYKSQDVDQGVFDTLMKPNNFAKAMYLKFARGVNSQKVVDALTAIQGVDDSIVQLFSSTLLTAMGTNISKGESIALIWLPKDTLTILVREVVVGSIQDSALPAAIFDLYLGNDPVSPPAKAAFGVGVQNLFL